MTQRFLSAVGIAIAMFFGHSSVLAGGAGGQNRNGDRPPYDSSDARQHGYEHGYRDGGPASATHLVVTVADPLEELDGGITHSKHGSILPVRT